MENIVLIDVYTHNKTYFSVTQKLKDTTFEIFLIFREFNPNYKEIIENNKNESLQEFDSDLYKIDIPVTEFVKHINDSGELLNEIELNKLLTNTSNIVKLNKYTSDAKFSGIIVDEMAKHYIHFGEIKLLGRFNCGISYDTLNEIEFEDKKAIENYINSIKNKYFETDLYLKYKNLIGYLDAIDYENGIIYEFKYVCKITLQHILQTLMYLVMFNETYGEVFNKIVIHNFKDGTLFKLEVNDKIYNMVIDLMDKFL